MNVRDSDRNKIAYAYKGKQRVQKAATDNKSEKQAMTANKKSTMRGQHVESKEDHGDERRIVPKGH